MNGYVTKKESICLFKTDREEQRGKGFVRGRKHQKSGETSCETVSALLREFRGEIVSADKMILYSMEN
ncbi:MAG TPA: hypothetical protein PKG60_02735 [Spirochaetota bacterium]|nr:hypothetical protein [Spirochaetota bacterium]HPS87558.1 hypothetical protein [Spirochaetota bacterium]